MESRDSYLVFRDAMLSVVERYILYNDYLDREELAALLGIALPKKQSTHSDQELEALKQVLTPDYTPTPPQKPEPVKYEFTCAKDNHIEPTTACCSERDCDDRSPCPDYVPEAPNDPLS